MITAAEAREDYNDERERNATLDYLRSAQQRYRALAEPMTASRLDTGRQRRSTRRP